MRSERLAVSAVERMSAEYWELIYLPNFGNVTLLSFGHFIAWKRDHAVGFDSFRRQFNLIEHEPHQGNI